MSKSWVEQIYRLTGFFRTTKGSLEAVSMDTWFGLEQNLFMVFY